LEALNYKPSLNGLDYELDDPGFESGRGKGRFFTPKRPDHLWVPPSLLINGCDGFSLNYKPSLNGLDYDLDDPGFESGRGKGRFFTPKRPDHLWVPPSLLINSCDGFSRR
jgi:hypothetical protein